VLVPCLADGNKSLSEPLSTGWIVYAPSGNGPGTSYYIRAAPQLGRLLYNWGNVTSLLYKMLNVDVNAISHGSDAGCGSRVAKIGHQETSLFDIFHILEARVLLLRGLPRLTGDVTSVEKWIEQAQRPQKFARHRPNSKRILEAESNYVSAKFWQPAVCYYQS
jgi:hypothetical protein